MWAVSPVQPTPFFPLFPKPSKPLVYRAVSASSQPSCHSSSPSQKHHQRIQNQEPQNQTQRGAVTNQLSGLDVLWAMQRAAAEKNRANGGTNKKNRKGKGKGKGKGLVSAGCQREEYAVDYSNVRPLCIKCEWGARLDELEKRLQELSETK